MRQTKESNKHAPGRVVIYMSVHLVLIYTLAFSNVLLVLALNLIVRKSSYCKCSVAWCQAWTFLLFTIWTHPLQMREYPLRYASTEKNKKPTIVNTVWVEKRYLNGHSTTKSLKLYFSLNDSCSRGYCTSYPKISMFCALSQNYQYLFLKNNVSSHSKLSKELKNSIKI